ncbi:hypothetical protein GCM10010911_03390 [Paenibacillus nasutitermitis]|uniref:Uncharacterized protein n=1 Tax=Paenibacillus nasutitermitis TaxID=1652958 RepID=A0A917DL36_9BACL|nr:hypothetical protein GCM10010911_03390 [Paenibacillus nasutitermitis]
MFSSVSKVMAHIYKVDCGWYDIMMGKSMKEALAASSQIEANAEAGSLEELEARYDDLSMRFKACINEHADLEKEVAGSGYIEQDVIPPWPFGRSGIFMSFHNENCRSTRA